MLPMLVLLAAPGESRWSSWAGVAIYVLIQAERLMEEAAPPVPYDYVAPCTRLLGRQAFAGLPVLIAQGLFIAGIGWLVLSTSWRERGALGQPRPKLRRR